VKLLAIDTSSVACTVALDDGNELIERHELQPREHTRLLMPMIRDVLEQAGLVPAQLDAIVLGNGPGSFIGMRIATSVSQGLAYAAGLKIIPVSSLAAVAAEVLAGSQAELVAVAQDAHMEQVYLGLYARCAGGLARPICDERLHGQSAIEELRSAQSSSVVVAGQGWQRYPALWDANEAVAGGRSAVLYPRASFLLALAEPSAAQSPAEIQPAYLRHKVAQKPRSGGS